MQWSYFSVYKFRFYINSNQFQLQFTLLGINDEDSGLEWIFKNLIYSEERGRPYLMSWIHSHVGGAECFFSSVDVHTQHTLAKFHEAVIGMVIQLNENDKIVHHDFYEMSRQGLRHVENCSKKRNCNSRQQHDSCYNTNLYKTASDKVMLHDDVGLRVQNFMLPNIGLQNQQPCGNETHHPMVNKNSYILQIHQILKFLFKKINVF